MQQVLCAQAEASKELQQQRDNAAVILQALLRGRNERSQAAWQQVDARQTAAMRQRAAQNAAAINLQSSQRKDGKNSDPGKGTAQCSSSLCCMAGSAGETENGSGGELAECTEGQGSTRKTSQLVVDKKKIAERKRVEDCRNAAAVSLQSVQRGKVARAKTSQLVVDKKAPERRESRTATKQCQGCKIFIKLSIFRTSGSPRRPGVATPCGARYRLQ